MKEAYDAVLREALQSEQRSQERGRADTGSDSEGSPFTDVGGINRRSFNPVLQQRAAVTMADFDLNYLTIVQSALRRAQHQEDAERRCG